VSSAAGVVALLFTDLVGSTELLARLGDDAAEDLRRVHFGLLRSAIDTNDGREVKTLGDGLMAAFSLEALHYLAHSCPDARLLVVATARPAELSAEPVAGMGPRAPFWLAFPLALAAVLYGRRSAFEDQRDGARVPEVAAAG
jgi:class 3 adenylate cyclase